MRGGIDKLDFTEIKKVLLWDRYHEEKKRQVTVWERICVKDVSDKGSLSRIYKELLKLSRKRTSDWFKNRPRPMSQRRYTNGI
jgi:hypothetical protein